MRETPGIGYPVRIYHWVYETSGLEARQAKIIALPAASITRTSRDRNR